MLWITQLRSACCSDEDDDNDTDEDDTLRKKPRVKQTEEGTSEKRGKKIKISERVAAEQNKK